MVDTVTFNKLTTDERNEYLKYKSKFIRAVMNSDAQNGFEFEEMYTVQNKGNDWFLAKTENDEVFAGITVSSKSVIDALFTNVAQNYGR